MLQKIFSWNVVLISFCLNRLKVEHAVIDAVYAEYKASERREFYQ